MVLLELPVVCEFVVGQGVGVEDGYEICQNQVGIDGTRFKIVTAHGRCGAQVVVPNTLIDNGRRMGKTRICLQQFTQTGVLVGMEPIICLEGVGVGLFRANYRRFVARL